MGFKSSDVSGGDTTAEQMQALIQHLPELAQVTTGITPGVEQGRVDVSRLISPQIAQLQTELLDTGGRDLARVGSEIAQENRLAQILGETEALQGPGRDLLEASREAAMITDPEFFKLREAATNSAIDLLGSSSVEPGGAELASIERMLNRQGLNRGANANSATETTRNAMSFGDELMKRRAALSNAINSATSLLPATRQGVDPFAQATGRVGTQNLGQQNFTGVQQQSNDSMQMSMNLLNQAGQNSRQANQINSENDFFDRTSQMLGGLGSFFGG